MGIHNTCRYILYRIIDPDGNLLYVGATTNPALRFVQHASTQPWWDEAANITLERFDSHEALMSAENAAIAIEGPRYNTLGLLTSARKPREPRRGKGEGSLFQNGAGYWVASVQVPSGPDGKRRYKRVVRKSKADARQRLDEMLAERASQS